MYLKEEGEGYYSECRSALILSANAVIYNTVYFGLLVWSTGLAPNPLIQSITEAEKDPKTSRSVPSHTRNHYQTHTIWISFTKFDHKRDLKCGHEGQRPG